MTEQERKAELVASLEAVIETLARHRKELRAVRRRYAAAWGVESARYLIDPIGMSMVVAWHALEAALRMSLASRRGDSSRGRGGAPGSDGA